LLIDGATSNTLDVSRTFGINNPFRLGQDRTSNSGNIEYSVPSANNNQSGEIIFTGKGAAGSAPAFGDIVVMDQGFWYKAQADAVSTSTGMMGIALGADPSISGVLIRGMFRSSDSWGLGGGEPFYLSTSSAGNGQSSAPSNSGDIVRIVGYEVYLIGNDNLFYICPDNTWIEIA